MERTPKRVGALDCSLNELCVTSAILNNKTKTRRVFFPLL